MSYATNSELPTRLAETLVQASGHRHRGAASMSYGRHNGPPRHDARTAAVLLLLYFHEGQWHIPMTLRPSHLATHAGQVSFPGGSVEPGETTQQAALREAHEELGIDPTQCELIGALSPVFVFNSNYDVRPWVAHTATRPKFRPNEEEVERLVEFPLDLLLRSGACQQLTIQRGGLQFDAPCLACEDLMIWGASLLILEELRKILNSLNL